MTATSSANLVLTGALAACDRIDAADPAISAFVTEPGRRKRVTAEAEGVQRRWPDPSGRPPLFGLPIGVKDVIRMAGLPTRAGSQLPAELLAGPQAEVVTRLETAGAIVAGKTVTAEFAVTAPGPTRNPRDPAHTPGGSSSGSAAAVAAGMVPLALGTQTIASVIRPAAYCGVPGFRPTYGRVPSDGVIAFAPNLDTVGWFAPDVAGLADAAVVLCDDWQSGARAELLVLGIPLGPYLERASTEALAAFADHADCLRRAGFTIRQVPIMPDFENVMRQLFVITRFELAREHATWFAQYGDRYRQQTSAMIREGQGISGREHEQALQWQQEFGPHVVEVMEQAGIDAWLTPAATGPAPASLDSTGDPVMSVPWSLARLPAVSLPAGVVGGLPVGVQCVGRHGADEQLLAAAALAESALLAARAS